MTFYSSTSRRAFIAGTAATALLAPGFPYAQSAAPAAGPDVAPDQPFTFDALTERARLRATQPLPAPEQIDSFFTGLDYDQYNLIAFRPARARWRDDGKWRLLPFHLGWLFKEPVHLFEVVDGQATPMVFHSSDFEYRHELKDKVDPAMELPGVAGFKLTHPLNRADLPDEIISFIGASYFRALGQGNTYGASARGLAIDSGLAKAEEFPRFSAFWLEKPAANADRIVVYAMLDSDSVAGAYRFEVTPGVDTTVEVTARLFFRQAVEQVGIAPLTSMFLYADINRERFRDYRPRVHDSNGLRIVRADGDVIWRALDNPERLASAYFTETQPRRFGLHQRGRDFDDYQDTSARYDLRPSVDVEPLGDWGKGTVRLFELPTDVEIHDNIGAFWIPDQPVAEGDAREFAYRLHWGRLDPDYRDDLAIVRATRSGVGGAAGLESPPDTRKFIVDFQGGMLGRMPESDTTVTPVVSVNGGTIDVMTFSKIPGEGIWRLAIDVAAESGTTVEMTAHIAGYDRKLSEIWTFQWIKP